MSYFYHMIVGNMITPEKDAHIMITQHSYSSLKTKVSLSKFFKFTPHVTGQKKKLKLTQ